MIGRVEYLCLFTDDEWPPFSALQILSLIDLNLTPPPAVRTPLSQTQFTARPQRNDRPPARFAFCPSRVPSPCRHSLSHLLLTLPSYVLLELIYPRISQQSGKNTCSRSDYEWRNRDEQLWWLSRREQYLRLFEQ